MKSFLFIILFFLVILSSYSLGEMSKVIIILCSFPLFFYYMYSKKIVLTHIQLITLIILFVISFLQIKNVFNLLIFINGYVFILFFLLYMKALDVKRKSIKYISLFLNLLVIANVFEFLSKKPLFYYGLKEEYIDYQIFFFNTDLYRSISLFGHPIISGIFFGVAFFLNDYLFKNIYLKIPLQLITLLAIYSTMSRSVWLSIILIILLRILKGIWKFDKFINMQLTFSKALFVSSIVMTIPVITYLNKDYIFNIFLNVMERFGTSLSDNSSDISNIQRVGTIQLIYEKILESDGFSLFFGHGIGSARKLLLDNPIFIQNFQTTDNQYLTFIYDGGLMILSIWIFIIIYAFTKLFNSNSEQKLFAELLIFVSITMFFFEITGWMTIQWLIAWVLYNLFISKDFEKNAKENN